MPLQDKRGFTLIEVIVIVSVLGILIAIAIPSFSGYLRKADESAAISECHQVVNAADAVVGSAYKTDRLKTDVFELTAKTPELIEEVKKTAEVNGSIYSASLSSNQKGNVILVNYETEDGIKVVYDEDWKYHGRQALYTVVKRFLGRLDQYVEDTTKFFLDPKNGVIKYGANGEYLFVNDSEGIGGYAGTQESLIKVDDIYYSKMPLYWKPYMMSNGKTFLFASEGNTDHGQWRAYLAYVGGKVYKVNPAKTMDNTEWAQIADVRDHRKNAETVIAYLKSVGFEEFAY